MTQFKFNATIEVQGMEQLFLKSLILGYACVSSISLAAYWPTIKDVLSKKPSANLASYFLWTVTGCITFLYSIFIIKDSLVQFFSGANFIACATILGLGAKIKNNNKKWK